MHSLALPLARGETLNKFLCFLYNEVITIHTSEICCGGAWLHEAFRVALDHSNYHHIQLHKCLFLKNIHEVIVHNCTLPTSAVCTDQGHSLMAV